MGDLKIWWKYVGGVSAISGLACFLLSSTYKMTFGKLGNGGLLSYLLVFLITGCLMMRGKRIQVSEKFKGVVGAILFVVICLISVVYDKYVPGKSDAYAITSYGSFALMSVSMSRKLELGFETGFSAFFLQLFAAQLFKIQWFLLPIALVFCSLVIILRHYCSEESSQAEPPILPVSELELTRMMSMRSSSPPRQLIRAMSMRIGSPPWQLSRLMSMRILSPPWQLPRMMSIRSGSPPRQLPRIMRKSNAIQRDTLRWSHPSPLHRLFFLIKSVLKNKKEFRGRHIA